jgi:hypothetical protein
VPEAFLAEVQEFLLIAGWALFWAGSSYAIIRLSAIEGWPRMSSKRIEDDLHRISRGRFDFGEIEQSVLSLDDIADEEEDSGE